MQTKITFVREKLLITSAIVLISVIFLSFTVRSTLDAYVAEQAEDTISTAVTRIQLVENSTAYVLGASHFRFSFRFEVWNSYPAPQTVITGSTCGIDPQVEASLVESTGATIRMFTFGQQCQFGNTRELFDTGVTPFDQYYYIRINLPNLEVLPDGNYTISYNDFFTFHPKYRAAYNATILVNDGNYVVAYDSLPSDWGSIDPNSRVVPIEWVPLLTSLGFLAFLHTYQRRNQQS